MPGIEYADTETGFDAALLPANDERVHVLPPYHVVLLDDDDHTYVYVIKMLQELFAYDVEEAYQLAVEVDTEGRAVVETTHKERAELKRDQILAFGRDGLLKRSEGSMTAVIEPAITD